MDKVQKFADLEVRAASQAGTRRSCSCHVGREPGPTGAAATLREDNWDLREARPPCRKTTGTHGRRGNPAGTETRQELQRREGTRTAHASGVSCPQLVSGVVVLLSMSSGIGLCLYSLLGTAFCLLNKKTC